MPCNSDYMAPMGSEIALSRVYQLLDELKGHRKRIDRRAWDGYDDRVYGNASAGRNTLDKRTAELCELFSKLSQKKIKSLSLEAQMWWRDHQEADKKQRKEAVQKVAREELRLRALAKLTHEEREALGIREEK